MNRNSGALVKIERTWHNPGVLDFENPNAHLNPLFKPKESGAISCRVQWAVCAWRKPLTRSQVEPGILIWGSSAWNIRKTKTRKPCQFSAGKEGRIPPNNNFPWLPSRETPQKIKKIQWLPRKTPQFIPSTRQFLPLCIWIQGARSWASRSRHPAPRPRGRPRCGWWRTPPPRR